MALLCVVLVVHRQRAVRPELLIHQLRLRCSYVRPGELSSLQVRQAFLLLHRCYQPWLQFTRLSIVMRNANKEVEEIAPGNRS